MSKKRHELSTPGLAEYDEPQSMTALKLANVTTDYFESLRTIAKVTGQLAAEQETTANLRKTLGDLVDVVDDSLIPVDSFNAISHARAAARKLLEELDD